MDGLDDLVGERYECCSNIKTSFGVILEKKKFTFGFSRNMSTSCRFEKGIASAVDSFWRKRKRAPRAL
jgi:hypothetical protein